MTTFQTLCLLLVFVPLTLVYVHQRNHPAYARYAPWGRFNTMGVLAALGLLIFLLMSPTWAPKLSVSTTQLRDYPWTHFGFEVTLSLLWLTTLFYLIFPHVAKEWMTRRKPWASDNRTSQYDTLWQRTLGVGLTILTTLITFASVMASR